MLLHQLELILKFVHFRVKSTLEDEHKRQAYAQSQKQSTIRFCYVAVVSLMAKFKRSNHYEVSKVAFISLFHYVNEMLLFSPFF